MKEKERNNVSTWICGVCGSKNDFWHAEHEKLRCNNCGKVFEDNVRAKDEKAEIPNLTLKCKACGTVYESKGICACPKCQTLEGSIVTVKRVRDKVKCLGCEKIIEKPCPTCDHPLCIDCGKRLTDGDVGFEDELRKKLFPEFVTHAKEETPEKRIDRKLELLDGVE